MKRINKVLILFLFLLSMSFFAVWEILQSQWVATQVSKVATRYIEDVLEADVEFNNLQFNLFPPGAEVRNVLFNGKKENSKISVEAGSVGVFFNPFDVFKTNFIIDNIVIEDAHVNIQSEKMGSSATKSKNNSPITVEAFDLLNDIPINRATAKDVKIQFNKSSVYTKFLELGNNKTNLSIKGEIQRLKINELIQLKGKVDAISIQASIDRSLIEVKNITIKSKLLTSSVNGTIKNYISRNVSYNLNSNTTTPLNYIHDWLEFKKVGVLNSGILKENSEIKGIGQKYEIESNVILDNFKTDFAYGELAKLNLSVNNDKIIFKKFELMHQKQKIKLVKPFEFFNLKTKKFVEEPIVADLTNIELNNILRYLRSSISLLEGDISGRVKFILNENDFSFLVKDNLNINSLRLVAGEDFEILSLSDFVMERGKFTVDRGTFLMDLFARNGETNFTLKSKINSNEFSLKMPTSFLELQKINHIAGYQMGGKGTFSFDLQKDQGEMVLYTDNDFKNYHFDGFKLNKVKAKINYLLGSNEINIEKLNASSGKSKIKLAGNLNYKNLDVSADYKVSKMNFNEVKKILNPVLKDVQLTSNEIHGDWDLSGSISGKARINDLIVTGQLSGKNNYFFDENLDEFNFNYKLESSFFRVSDFTAKKGRGNIKSNFSYDIKKNDLSFNSQLNSVSIQDFTYYSKLPISLKSDIDGNIWGRLVDQKWNFGSDFKLLNSKVFSRKYPDSQVKFKMNEKVMSIDVDIFSGKLHLDSKISLDESERSKLNIDIDFKDIKDFLGVFSGIDLVNSNINGNIKYSLRSDIDSTKFEIINMKSNLSRFILDKPPISVNYKNNFPEIEVVNRKIEKWKMNVRGKKFYVLSNGSGKVGEEYNTTTQMKVDASIVEIFNDIVSKANGNIRGKLAYGQSEGEDIYEAYVASSNLTLTSRYLPTSITKADMKISFKDNILSIEKFYAHLISGTLGIKGSVSLDSVIPDINLRYDFKDAGLTVLKKSSLIFSGAGSLIGKNFPYTLGGDFHIQKFNIVNEPTDFGLGSSGFTSSEIDYLPGKVARVSDQLLNFNLNIVTREPIFIRNSLADMGFVGNLQVLGGEKDPRLSGKINLAPRNNKVSFKNNEFNFSKGNIVFSERNSFKNPELDFFASSIISNYKVNIALVGPVKNFDFSLASEPSLAQSDILSLIAFGYTEDLSNNLSDAEKESMTRAGVGSIIFDSFKINETLKNEFGLQVNLGTEISQDESSYLSSRNSEGGNSVGKVRSATTFEVKKKLDDDMSMSVSSTVGTSSNQKQSLNLNYNLNSSVSVEGVYESNNRNDQETINDDTSFGADVKWKWSFK